MYVLWLDHKFMWRQHLNYRPIPGWAVGIRQNCRLLRARHKLHVCTATSWRVIVSLLCVFCEILVWLNMKHALLWKRFAHKAILRVQYIDVSRLLILVYISTYRKARVGVRIFSLEALHRVIPMLRVWIVNTSQNTRHTVSCTERAQWRALMWMCDASKVTPSRWPNA